MAGVPGVPSPVQVQYEMHGEIVPLYTGLVGSAGYNPDSTEDFDPGDAVPTNVKGFWADFVEVPTDMKIDGVFTIWTTGPIAGLVAQQAKILHGGVYYTVAKIRERNFDGATDGYECWLVV